MKKLIAYTLLIITLITIIFKVNTFKEIKVFVLTKLNTITKTIKQTKELKQTKENLLNIIKDYENKLEQYSQLITQNEILTKENKELKQLMNIQSEKYTIIYADIVEKSLLYDYIIINKGKKNGIKQGSAVICSNTFIGIIDKVNNNSSTVKLITSMNYPVMHAPTNTVGQITSYKDGYYIVKDMQNEIQVGDTITTTKYSLNIPSGLLIGQVENIENDNLELSKTLKVKQSYDYNKISAVGVMVK